MLSWKVKSTQDTLQVNILQFLLVFFRLQKADPGCPVYHSLKYAFSFSEMREYWEELGKREAAIDIISSKGRRSSVWAISTEEMIQRAFSSAVGEGQAVVLFNLSLEGYSRLGQSGILPKQVLDEDFVFLACDSREKARKILEKIPSNQAWIVAMDRGVIFDQNY